MPTIRLRLKYIQLDASVEFKRIDVGGWVSGKTFSLLVKPNFALTLTREYEPPRDKTNKVSVRAAKTQISLGICPV